MSAKSRAIKRRKAQLRQLEIGREIRAVISGPVNCKSGVKQAGKRSAAAAREKQYRPGEDSHEKGSPFRHKGRWHPLYLNRTGKTWIRKDEPKSSGLIRV